MTSFQKLDSTFNFREIWSQKITRFGFNLTCDQFENSLKKTLALPWRRIQINISCVSGKYSNKTVVSFTNFLSISESSHGYFPGEKVHRHFDSNPQPSDPVVLNNNQSSPTGLGSFWLAQSGPNW